MKRCTTCKIEKPFEEFSKDKYAKDGYKQQCKTCVKHYRQENKDKITEYYKQHYEENKDKILEQKKQYQKENKDKIAEQKKRYRQENKEKVSEKYKKYYQENKDKFLANSAKRRAKKLQATPSWLTPEHYQEIFNIYKIRQDVSDETGILHHVDHIVPLQGETVCGLHVPWNLRVIPAEENLSKNNKFDEELLETLDIGQDL